MIAFVLAAALSGAVVDGGAVQDAIANLPAGTGATGGGIELVVDTAGRVRSCRPLVAVGGPEVAAAMCNRLSRTRLKPATADDGSHAYGLVRLFSQRVPSGSMHEAWTVGLRPELEITMASRPSSTPADGIVAASVAVGANGMIERCEVHDPGRAAFEDAACEGLRTLQFDPVMGPDGQPVGFVSEIAVRFVG